MGNTSKEVDVPLGQKKEKPWGYERPLTRFQGINLKELFFKANQQSSKHYHKEKDELLYIVYGQVRVLVGEKEVLLLAGDIIHIPPDQPHRICGEHESLLLEVSTRMFGDVFRLEDDYNRASQE